MIAAVSHGGRCALPHCFNLVTSGERLGELAAVLTALTFTAVIFLAGRDGRQRKLESAQVLLFGAFVALATATYLFSGVAAEELPGARAAFEAFSASLVLSLALQLLFLGVVQLMRDHEFESATQFAALVGTWFVGPIIMIFMCATAVDGVGLYLSSSVAYRSGTGLTCIGFCVILLAWMLGSHAFFRRPLRARVPWPSAAQWTGGILGVVAIASVITLVWAEVGRADGMPPAVYLALMALLLLATMGYSARLTHVGMTTRRRLRARGSSGARGGAESMTPAASAGDAR
jgi:hypothetical protein